MQFFQVYSILVQCMLIIKNYWLRNLQNSWHGVEAVDLLLKCRQTCKRQLERLSLPRMGWLINFWCRLIHYLNWFRNLFNWFRSFFFSGLFTMLPLIIVFCRLGFLWRFTGSAFHLNFILNFYFNI